MGKNVTCPMCREKKMTPVVCIDTPPKFAKRGGNEKEKKKDNDVQVYELE